MFFEELRSYLLVFFFLEHDATLLLKRDPKLKMLVWFSQNPEDHKKEWYKLIEKFPQICFIKALCWADVTSRCVV